MKPKPTPFCDTFDRLYLLNNIHKGKVVEHEEKPGNFFHYMNGDLAHLMVYVKGKIHIRYVPCHTVQYFFDRWGS